MNSQPKTTHIEQERKLMEMQYELDTHIKQLEADARVSSAKGIPAENKNYIALFEEKENMEKDIEKLKMLQNAFKQYQLEGTPQNKLTLLDLCNNKNNEYKTHEAIGVIQEVQRFINKNENYYRPRTTLTEIEEKIIPNDRKEVAAQMLETIQSKIREEQTKIVKIKKQCDKSDDSELENLDHFALRLNHLLAAEACIKSYQINRNGNYNESKLLEELTPIREALEADKGKTSKKNLAQKESALGKFKEMVSVRFKPNSSHVVEHIMNIVNAKQRKDFEMAAKPEPKKIQPKG